MRRIGIHTITFTAHTVTPTPTVVNEKGGLYLLSFRGELRIDDSNHPTLTSPVDYAPGSSLKGRMRSLLETELGRVDTTGTAGATRRARGSEVGRPCKCAQDDCPVCRVFGANSTDTRLGPSRIIVRDGRVKDALQDDGRAKEGEFDMEIVLQVYENDTQFSYTRIRGKNGISYQGDEALQAVIADGLQMVTEPGRDTRNRQHTGRIRFTDFKMDGAEWTIWSDSS